MRSCTSRKHPMKLVSAHALLAGAKQMKREQPLVQRNVAIFHDGSDRDAELFPAGPAVPQSLAPVAFGGLAREIGFQPVGFANSVTAGAHGATRPPFCFQATERG